MIADKDPQIRFTLKDRNANKILIFKDIEECAYWKVKDGEPEYIEAFLKNNSAEKCEYIYFMFDYAYLQLIGHNVDDEDLGRGYNVYSFKRFFESYFGTDEYNTFEKELKSYIDGVNDALGYINVKSLTPNTMMNFRRVLERILEKFPYDVLKGDIRKEFELEETDYIKIYDQFINEGAFRVLLGNHSFAESIITAEWLYGSMKKAKAVDLTIIGMGYCKAVEQLLYELIILRKDKITDVEFNENDSSWFTIGTMAIVYKNHMEAFLRGDLKWRSKKYIRETVFSFKDIRNGYFHKDNISDWGKIDKIREATYQLLFLLIGSYSYNAGEKETLGLPVVQRHSDYYKLCEYVNFHAGDIFFLCREDGKEMCLIAENDIQARFIDNAFIEYSGMYFKDLGKDGRKYMVKEGSLPKKIYLGKLDIKQTADIVWNPVKTLKIFEDGKFVGPSIVDEGCFDY
jgi:hypothetical protein